MKRFIALLTALCLLAALGVAAAESTDALTAAKDYLYMMYRAKPETTPSDYTVVGVVNIGGVEYQVDWTTDSDTIQVVRGEDKMVTIDLDEKNPEELQYVLTATISDADGNSQSVSFNHKVPAALILDAGMSYAEIVDIAYTLEDGLSLEETFRLYGTVVSIDTPWSDEYENITVTIQIGDLADQPIQCYRLAGEGAKDLAVGDDITVEGILTNYKGTIEFDQGCVLVGYGEHVSQKAILDAAYKLEDGVALTSPTVLRGEVVSIDTAWSDEYQNITVTIVCDGLTDQPIQCYRLAGEGAKDLAVGDDIAVAGVIKNYKGTIEFDQGCALVVPVESAIDARAAVSAYGLEVDLAMTESSTITGVITAIDTPWSDEYQNITVIMTVGGLADYPIMCYRLAGEGAQDLAIGDTITVSGIIKNYKGTIEFDQGCTLDAVVKAE
ncbi:MAG TPA: hypothetical protein IAC48_01630 [Candidatus Limiplasma stercoravium]|nr:hypothetical protein [Candidatus Limiplasma stercoravium]